MLLLSCFNMKNQIQSLGPLSNERLIVHKSFQWNVKLLILWKRSSATQSLKADNNPRTWNRANMHWSMSWKFLQGKKKSNFCLSTKQEERFVLCLKWFREAAVYSRSPLKHTACQKGAIQRLTKCNQPPGYRHFSFHTSQVWSDRSFFIIIRHLKPDESELLVKQHIGNHTKHQQ